MGVDNIPVAAMTERGIPVFNAPGANANAVRELTVLGMLMAARNVVGAIAFTQGHAGETDIAKSAEAAKKEFAGTELAGKTLGLIGLGAIGGLVAEAALAFGMHVVGYDTELPAARALKLPQALSLAPSLDELLETSDFISLHLPFIPGEHGTLHFIDSTRIKRMKQGVVLLNLARPEVVSEAAVLEALTVGKIQSYVCDFPSPELSAQLGLGVILLPHLGASTDGAEEKSATMVLEQLFDYLENGNVTNAVNFPNLKLSRQTAYRLTVAHRNVEGVLETILAQLAQSRVNIARMELNTRGDIGYVIFEFEAEISEGLIGVISELSNVLRARYLAP